MWGVVRERELQEVRWESKGLMCLPVELQFYFSMGGL